MAVLVGMARVAKVVEARVAEAGMVEGGCSPQWEWAAVVAAATEQVVWVVERVEAEMAGARVAADRVVD